jgi:hypothetical protein
MTRALWLNFVRANEGGGDPDCAKPTITALSNAPGSLRVFASGVALSYEWFAGESGVTSAPVAVTTSVLAAPPGRYWVRVTNRCGSALSVAGTISAGSSRRRATRH